MAIKSAQPVSSGDYLDVKALAASAPDGVLVLFRIRDYLPAIPSDYNGPDGRPRNTYPVVVDALICDGPRAGEVFTAEELKFSVAHALRGTTVSAADAGVPPANAPGEEVGARLLIVKKKGSNPFAGLDPITEEERVKMEQLRAAKGGDAWGTPGAVVAVQPQPAMAGAPAGVPAARPWG